MKEILEYIKDGVTIEGNPEDGYTVFTVPTQHFKINSLEELTVDTFENAIQKLKERQDFEYMFIKYISKYYY